MSVRNVSRLSFAALTVLLSVAASAHAQTYNAVADFSNANNPNGVWSYGDTPTRGGAFSLYDVAASSVVGLEGWSVGGADITTTPPYVMHNSTSDPIVYSSLTLPPDLLNLHPGPNGENTVVRWTAPLSGVYTIQGRFQGLDSTTTDVSLLKNSGSELFTGDIDGYGDTQTFGLNVLLNSGDAIDFSVGYGNGDYGFDSTGLSATITPSPSDVPEPGVLTFGIVSALGVCGLLVRKRRQA